MPIPLTELSTARLVLRPYGPDDAQQLLALGTANREHLARFESDNPVRHLATLTQATELIASFADWWQAGDAHFLGIFRREAEALIGQVYIGVVTRDPPAYVIGYIVDKDNEGRGYVTESVLRVVEWLFRDLGAHRVDIECDDSNARSAAVAERCAFDQLSHQPATHHHADGTTTGTVVFRLTRAGWE